MKKILLFLLPFLLLVSPINYSYGQKPKPKTIKKVVEKLSEIKNSNKVIIYTNFHGPKVNVQASKTVPKPSYFDKLASIPRYESLRTNNYAAILPQVKKASQPTMAVATLATAAAFHPSPIDVEIFFNILSSSPYKTVKHAPYEARNNVDGAANTLQATPEMVTNNELTTTTENQVQKAGEEEESDGDDEDSDGDRNNENKTSISSPKPIPAIPPDKEIYVMPVDDFFNMELDL